MLRIAVLLVCAEFSQGVPRWALLQGATGSLFVRGVAAVGGAAAASGVAVRTARADATITKLTGLSPEDMAAMVEKDMSQNQFLVTGRLTRSVYAESASFEDAIDTCHM